MAIRRRTLLLGSQLRTKIGTEADEATRALTTAWVNAWGILSKEMESAVLDVLALATSLGRWPSPYELRQVSRLAAVLMNAQQALVNLGTRAGVTITDAAGNAIQSTVDAEPNIMASQLPLAERAAAAAKFAANIPPSALDIIVARTSHQITSSTRQLSAEATESMNRQLIRGIALGSNPRQAASQMVAGLKDGFDGGLSRAVNIARTETLDAYRGTSQYAHMANSDVLSGWMWLCTMSSRTCPSCIAMNGREFPLSQPGPQDHQSGRCTRMPIVKPWSELGIKTPEPPSTIPDARKWFSQQTAETQAQMLGPGRLNLLNSGKITWDDIPKQRLTSGWRPSYAPASLKDLQRIAAPGRGTPLLPEPSFADRLAAAATGAKARAAATLSRLTTRDEMSDAELKALYDYTGLTYGEVNRPLRAGAGVLKTVTDPDVRQQIRLIDAAMRRSPLTSDAVLYRGIGNGQLVFGDHWADNLTGAEWTENAYLSTSSNARQAGIFSTQAGARIQLLAPRGTHGIELTGDDSEAEVLLARGLKLRIVSDSGPTKIPRILDVEVIT